MRRWKVLLVALSIFLLGAQQSRQSRTPEEYIKLLESERRTDQLQVDRVIATLKIAPGQRVADIGSGSGLFTRPIARQLGEKGIIYAIDVDTELLKYVEQTAREQKLNNIRTILAAADDPKLPEAVDWMVIIDTLHHIGNQAAYLKNLKRHLRPGGRIAIIDFSDSWPQGHESMKYSLDDLDGWMKAAGFKRIEKHDFLNNNFFVIYQ
jgi:cyclopropane fatty-acyl-phospholipid synthase-like methyltransferase